MTPVEAEILDHLRHIRAQVDAIGLDIQGLKERLGRLEVLTAGLHGDFASLSVRFDRMDRRIARIEQRLGLVEA